jgi:hypothetical protein
MAVHPERSVQAREKPMKATSLLVVAMLTLAARMAVSTPPTSPPPVLYLLDLAGGDTTTPVEPGKEFQFQIIDELPAKVAPYSITRQLENEAIAPLSSPFGGGQQISPHGATVSTVTPTTCDTQRQQLEQKLEMATSEADIKTTIALNPPAGDCQAILQQLIDTQTKTPEQSMTLKSGQVATITVTRSPLTGEKDTRTWTFKFTAGVQGAWLMHYGFSFLGNRDHAFFAAAVPNAPGGQAGQGTQYRITPKATRNNLQYLPSFTFSYVPAYFQRRGWGVAPTAGLGTDLSNVAAFVGASLIVRDNVNLYVGVAGAKQQRLNGKYHSGDTVTTNLSEDQVNDKVYAPTVVFGVGFRFSSNPFNSSGSGQGTGNQPAKPKTGSSTP